MNSFILICLQDQRQKQSLNPYSLPRENETPEEKNMRLIDYTIIAKKQQLERKTICEKLFKDHLTLISKQDKKIYIMSMTLFNVFN